MLDSLVWLDIELRGLREVLDLPDGQIVTAADEPDEEKRARVRVFVTGGPIPVANALLDSLPGLKLVVSIAAGHDGIDLAHCRKRGIRVTSSIGVNAPDVADVAVGSLIALVRQIVAGDRLVRDGGWYPRRVAPTRSIGALKVGVFGLGSIGLQIARRIEAFGCAVAWHGPRPKDVTWPRLPSLLALAVTSDVLFVAAPLSDETRRSVNREVIDALGPEGYLVNVGRGAMIDEDALIAALREGRLGGAALDVFDEEPTPPARWADVPNTVLTPHLGGVTHESLRGILTRTAQSVRRGLSGELPEVLVA